MTIKPDCQVLGDVAQHQILSKYYCIAQLSLDGIFLQLNEKFEDTFGYAADELVGRHHRRLLINPLRPDPDYESMWQSFSDGIARSGEVLRRTKSGEIIWLQALYCPVKDEAGKVTSVMKTGLVKSAALVDTGISAPMLQVV